LPSVISQASSKIRLPGGLDEYATARLLIAVFQGLVLQQAWDPSVDATACAQALTILMAAQTGPRKGARTMEAIQQGVGRTSYTFLSWRVTVECYLAVPRTLGPTLRPAAPQLYRTLACDRSKVHVAFGVRNCLKRVFAFIRFSLKIRHRTGLQFCQVDSL